MALYLSWDGQTVLRNPIPAHTAVPILVHGHTATAGTATIKVAGRVVGTAPITGTGPTTVVCDLYAVPVGTRHLDASTPGESTHKETRVLAEVLTPDPDPDLVILSSGRPVEEVPLPTVSGTLRPDGTSWPGDDGRAAVTVRVGAASHAGPRDVQLLGTTARATAVVEPYPNGKAYAHADLHLAHVPPGEHRLRTSWTNPAGRTLYRDAAVTVAGMSGDDQIEHRAPCRLPWGDLIRVTPAEAATMPEITGYLVSGSLTTGGRLTDTIVQATGRSEYVLRRASGTYPKAHHVTVTGLERDDAGHPKRLHSVNRVVGSRFEIDHGVLAWGNDGMNLESGSVLRHVVVTGHAYFTKRNTDGTYVPQHPDGLQLQTGSGRRIEGVVLRCGAQPRPLMADGTPVPGCEYEQVIQDGKPLTIAGIRGCTGMMLNNIGDKSLDGLDVLRDLWVDQNTGFALNLSGGTRPSDGRPWWEHAHDADGALVKGLVVKGLTLTGPGNNADLRGPDTLVRRIIAEPTNARAYPGQPVTPLVRHAAYVW